MPVAIETVIIIIVVVSFAVLSAVLFALYWLWRLLLEDRRCNRLRNSQFHHDWQSPSLIGQLEDGQRALLGSRRDRNPRITRRQEVFVDERSRRMVKGARCTECPPPRATVGTMTTPVPIHVTEIIPSIPRIDATLPSEVVVLDGTEPPPPYEAVTR